MFFKKLCIYILFLLVISSCASTKINPNIYTQENVKGPIDIGDLLNQDQYNYKYQHLARLDKAISYYQQLQANYPTGFKKISGTGFIFGKRYSQVKDLRLRLYQEGINLKNLNSSLYDLEVFMAVKRFQEIHGLVETGIVDAKTEAALNIDLATKFHYLQQSRKNVEALPAELAKKYIVINIPAYKLYAFKKDHHIKDIDVIVGTFENKTPILINSRLTNIFFNPSWVVPPSLLYTEILEQLIADSAAMKNDGFEVFAYDNATKTYVTKDITSIDWKKYNKTHFPFVIKMKAGKNNPMGKIKFEFTNKQSITIHGTIDHDLFLSNIRTSSVGCIRLKDELVLAEFVLDGKKGWNLAKIQNLYKAIVEGTLNGVYNQQVTIDEKIPVNIIYQNAWVNDLGFVNFREDVYLNMLQAKK